MGNQKETQVQEKRSEEMAQLLSPSLPIPTRNPRLCLSHTHSQLLPGTAAFNLSLPRFFPTTTTKPELSLRCQYSKQPQSSTSESFPTFYPAEASGLPPRVYVGHSIYKGKAALTVEPKAPEFTCLDSGAYKLSREGFVLLQFAPAAGFRTYDWSRKQVFSLSVDEIGTLISLGGKGSCEFYHDPMMGKSDEGQIKKILKVGPLPDGSGHFFNISVQNKLTNIDDSIYIPVTKGEYTILASAFNFIVPYLIGWHAFANNTKPENIGPVNSGRYGANSEWNR